MKNVLLTTLVFCLAMTMNAQDTKKTVILINGQPTEVNLSAGGSYSGNTPKTNYMDGYVKPPANFSRTAQESSEVASVRRGASSPTKVISFNADQTSLSEQGMQELEGLISQINSAPKGYVLLRSSFNKSSSLSDIMAQKRVYACKKYLELRDIAPNKILVSLEPASIDNNNVSVFIR